MKIRDEGRDGAAGSAQWGEEGPPPPCCSGSAGGKGKLGKLDEAQG